MVLMKHHVQARVILRQVNVDGKIQDVEIGWTGLDIKERHRLMALDHPPIIQRTLPLVCFIVYIMNNPPYLFANIEAMYFSTAR